MASICIFILSFGRDLPTISNEITGVFSFSKEFPVIWDGEDFWEKYYMAKVFSNREFMTTKKEEQHHKSTKNR